MNPDSRAPAPASTAYPPRRDRVLIWTCLAVVVALAWANLLHLSRRMTSAMEYDEMMAKMGMAMPMPPWTPADVWFTFAMWVVMMVGMMTPGAAPVLLLYASAQSKRGSARVAVPVLMFGSGYLLVWGAFSACAALAQWLLHQQAMLSPMMAAASPRVGGAILIGAGLYQFTPLKHACLSHCQSPLGFLMTHWRGGATGALRMGAEHGVYCLGCCWALMAVLFVVGVMNLVWVAALMAFVLIEKVVPAGALVARLAGAALIVVGILMVATR